jgi:hypothetical protein
MHRVVIAIALLGTLGRAIASAQPRTEETAVLAVVDRFMVAVSTNDSKLMASLHLEGAVHIGVRTNESGSATVFRRGLAPPDQKPAVPSVRRERYWDPTVHIRGSIAVVWTPYEFWRDGKTTHCGIDVLNLVKQDGVWRIASMMWTVEPDACLELRPSDSARVRPAQ